MGDAVDRLTVTVRHVKDEMSPPDRVVSVELDEVEGLDLKEVIDLLHSNRVFTYKISESKTIGNWGASWGFQEIVITVAAMAEIINLLVNLARSKRGNDGLAAEEGVERAASFVRDNFAPQGQLVSDGVTRTATGLTAKFHDDKCAYHLSFSDAGTLIDAKRADLIEPGTGTGPTG